MRVFFFARPRPEEVSDVAAALTWLRARWYWLAAGYGAFFALLVAPGLMRGKGTDYAVASVVIPHFSLYMLLGMVAYCWVGFRADMTGAIVDALRRAQRRWVVWLRLVLAVVLTIAAFRVALWLLVGPAADEWYRDTFTPNVLKGLFVALLIAVPEGIVQLRLRQHRLTQQLLEAQTAQERLARATAENELRLLQAQVEPHFLYNTLANLRYLVQTGSPDGLRMTDALIEYLRTSVPDMRAQRVTLGREMDHAGHYLEIMRLRMGGRLTHSIDLPAALRDVELPPLLLLTLVENAIKHGIGPRIEGGQVALAATDEGENVRIEVVDDGVGVEAQSRSDAPSTGTGLRNLVGRLSLVYGESARFSLQSRQPHGTRAVIVLPRQAPPPAGGPGVDALITTDDGAGTRDIALPVGTSAH